MKNNELPKEDKQLIGKIDEMLTQLNGFGKSLWELREHASLVLPDIAPVDTKEEVANTLPDFGKYLSQQAYLSQQGEQPNQIKEEVKERFEVEVVERYFVKGDHVIVISTNNVKLGIEAAQSLADKIKSLLATL